jgi:methionine synthase reductase
MGIASNYAVLWASQTGNAEWIAKNIHDEAKSKGYTGGCFVMDDFDSVNLNGMGIISHHNSLLLF